MSAAAVALVGGLIIGCFYALVGVGFGLLHRVGETNLGYGDGLVLAAFVAAGVATATAQPLLGLAAGVGSGVVLALIAERLALRPLLGSPAATIVATTGLALVWRDASQLLSPASDAVVGSSLETAHLTLAGVAVDAATIVTLAVLAAAVAAVIVVPRRTAWGRRARAVGDDRIGAALSGVAPARTMRPIHIASGAIGAVAGLLLASHLGVLSVNLGWQLTLVGFVAATLGGRRGAEAAAAGGLGLGLLQTAVQVWVGSIWAGIASLAALALVLVARPAGLVAAAEVRA
ncbi:MAG: ABC transporter permease subunit [Candidatus Dormibacteria bacterium]